MVHDMWHIIYYILYIVYRILYIVYIMLYYTILCIYICRPYTTYYPVWLCSCPDPAPTPPPREPRCNRPASIPASPPQRRKNPPVFGWLTSGIWLESGWNMAGIWWFLGVSGGNWLENKKQNWKWKWCSSFTTWNESEYVRYQPQNQQGHGFDDSTGFWFLDTSTGYGSKPW